MARRWSQVWALIFVTLACHLPFLAKPFNMDDPLFVWTAEHICSHPLDFYGFDVNWYGYAHPMSRITKNPPLVSYYLALVGIVFGFHPVAMHAALLLPNVALVLGTYFVARPLCEQPFWAALVALFTPVVLVSSLTVMCDMTMLAFWCWALVAWMAALRTNRASLFVIAGLLAGLSALAKYFAISLMAIFAFHALATRPRRVRGLIGLVVSAAMILAYNVYAGRLYGRAPLLDAAGYVQLVASPDRLMAAVHALLFLGGCYATFLVLAPWLWSWRWLLSAVVLGTLAAVALAAVGLPSAMFAQARANDLIIILHVVVFTLAAINVAALAIADLMARRDATSGLLLLWLLGTFLFAAFGNWTVNGRTLLAAAPACAILAVRRLQARGGAWFHPDAQARWYCLTSAAVLSLAVLWADCQFAYSVREAATRLAERYLPESDPLWFEGHWGFQYYMQALGARPLDYFDSHLETGEIVIIPRNNTCLYYFDPWLRQSVTAQLRALPWAATVNWALGVNFYSGIKQVPLPYLFHPIPPEHYDVFESTKNVTLAAPPELKERGGDYWK